MLKKKSFQMINAKKMDIDGGIKFRAFFHYITMATQFNINSCSNDKREVDCTGGKHYEQYQTSNFSNTNKLLKKV
ncbi:hypothetical protein POCGH01_14068100 [Plasmodium ovale]|uniref:Uncharacterized protein n=2 Tax=Plasmodium ovale TaxID=36330 RepID=A0A1A8X5B4_PLAOA|nr:hypothetical protein POVCU2_0050910 [Plasmodium ovale curtisi]SBT00450.1 hypothetical protein POVCU1_060060 [Plasmodium ovale curtisi]SCQ17236.1 hypothetical protein POCGH01_14068100 [Plasmodium ovale]